MSVRVGVQRTGAGWHVGHPRASLGTPGRLHVTLPRPGTQLSQAGLGGPTARMAHAASEEQCTVRSAVAAVATALRRGVPSAPVNAAVAGPLRELVHDREDVRSTQLRPGITALVKRSGPLSRYTCLGPSEHCHAGSVTSVIGGPRCARRWLRSGCSHRWCS